MTSEISIRTIENADFQQVANLMVELGYPTTIDEMQKRLKDIQAHGNYKTLVAVKNKEIVGMIGLVKNFMWEQNGCYIRIQALVVKQADRQSGVGKKLIEAAEIWANEKGASFIALNCGNRKEREAAHQFYPKIGFTAKSTGYIKYLPPSF
jgi:predicted N-acetyltransferase YhbS